LTLRTLGKLGKFKTQEWEDREHSGLLLYVGDSSGDQSWVVCGTMGLTCGLIEKFVLFMSLYECFPCFWK
jgi:hypothetical protein